MKDLTMSTKIFSVFLLIGTLMMFLGTIYTAFSWEQSQPLFNLGGVSDAMPEREDLS